MNRSAVIILGLVVAHLAIVFATPQIVAHEGSEEFLVPIYFLFGICISHVNLLALWAVFAPGSLFWRGTVSAFLMAMAAFAIIGSNYLAWGYFTGRDVAWLGGSQVGGLVAAQIPLWIARRRWGWRLATRGNATVHQPSQQFSLWQIMLGITFFGCVLGLGKWLWRWQLFFIDPWEDLVLFGFILITALANGCLAWHAIWVTWRAPTFRLLGLGDVLALSVVVTLLQTLAYGLFPDRGGQEDQFLYHVAALNAGQIVSLFVTLGILRWQGFRLLAKSQWQREQAPAVERLASEAELATDAFPQKVT